jgi:diacylglycerol kinase (ATP)
MAGAGRARRSGGTGTVEALGHASRGVALLFRSQAKARLQGVACLGLCGLAALLGLSGLEWGLLLLALTLVWTAEALNTALEFLTDLVSPDYHVLAGRAKDAASGATLIALLGALAIVGLAFAPHLRSLWAAR